MVHRKSHLKGLLVQGHWKTDYLPGGLWCLRSNVTNVLAHLEPFTISFGKLWAMNLMVTYFIAHSEITEVLFSDPSLPTISMRLGYVIRRESHNLKWLWEWVFLPKVLYHKLRWTEKSLRNTEQEFTSSSLFVLPMKKQTQRQTICVFSEGSYEAWWRQDFLSFQSQALYTTPAVLKEGKWGRGPQTGSISITWELVRNTTSQAPSQA